MNTWNKDKKNNAFLNAKKRTNWNQSLKPVKPIKIEKKVKKILQYLLLINKFDNLIKFTNIKLLRVFLNNYGKIRSRRKTRLPVQKQREISKAIRKSRAFGLIPFTCELKN